MFDRNSGLVKIYIRCIKAGKYELKDVPSLDNLKEVVAEILGE